MKIKRAVQVSILILALTSGILLGLSQKNMQLMMVATLGGLIGFIVSDWLELFQLRGLFANIASVFVLVFAMQDFVGADGAGKLVSVSNLLVYLQTVLMFQEKTPRLNWQLLVLSLLQIVVAAIFNLNFEGGLLFVCYFGIAGITLILQAIYTNNFDIQAQNRRATTELTKLTREPTSLLPAIVTGAGENSNRPIAYFDSLAADLGGFRRMFQHLVLWLGISLIFSTVLFYIIPRGEQAWFGPNFVNASATGASKKVDLDERGTIEQSTRLAMRAWFYKKTNGNDVEFQPNGAAYFRGMALANLAIENDKTTWTAPYDRVYTTVYQVLHQKRDGWRNAAEVQIMLQPSSDPLVYSVTPTYAGDSSPSAIEYCFELAGFSRRKDRDQIETTPFTYRLKTYMAPDGSLLDSWPYWSDQSRIDSDSPMSSDNAGQERWLTDMDPARYPTLVKVADQIASRHRNNRMDLVRAMERHFDSYTYTLDFQTIQFQDDVDPVEDFFANHKTGHCELHASALTLMLRSQGIPARLVVGYYVPEYDKDAACYMIRDSNAHAWVEAYIEPEDCTEIMFNLNAAGRGGAWVRLDPSPASELQNTGGGSAIESARTLWQDYVLGLDSTRQDQTAFEASSSRLLGLFDLSNWNAGYQKITQEMEERPVLQAGTIAFVLGVIMFGAFRMIFRNGTSKKSKSEKDAVGGLRRFLGGALSLISPTMGRWMLGERDKGVSTGFYRRLTKILEATGNERDPAQTHRDFAKSTISKLSGNDSTGIVADTIHEVTELFYRVRFGEHQLSTSQLEDVDAKLGELEQQLGTIGVPSSPPS